MAQLKNDDETQLNSLEKKYNQEGVMAAEAEHEVLQVRLWVHIDVLQHSKPDIELLYSRILVVIHLLLNNLKFWVSGMWHCVVGQVVSNIAEDHHVFISRVQQSFLLQQLDCVIELTVNL